MRPRLGQLLRESGALSAEQVQGALAYQVRRHCKLGQAVVELRMLTEGSMLDALARHLCVARVGREVLDQVPSSLVHSVPPLLLRRLRVCPLAREEPRVDPRGERRPGPGLLWVATSQAEDLPLLDAISFVTACEVRPVLASAVDVERALRRHGVLLPRRLQALDLPEAEPPEAFVILRNSWRAYS